MIQERLEMTYRCGPPSRGASEVPTFTDLLEARKAPLAGRVGLLRAAELIRAISGSKGCETTIDLVVESPADLDDPWGQQIVVFLLDAVGSRLKVGDEFVSLESTDDADEGLAAVLRAFSATVPFATLLSLGWMDDPMRASARCLCSKLQLTGRQAAWAMNLATNSTRFSDRSVRYHVRSAAPLRSLFDELKTVELPYRAIGETNLDFLGSPLPIRLDEGERPGPDQALLHQAYLLYQELQPGSVVVPNSWVAPRVRQARLEKLRRAMEVIVPVRRMAYASMPWTPGDRDHARRFAQGLDDEGQGKKAIAAALNEQGYRLARNGGWHHRAVRTLLDDGEEVAR